MISEVQIEPCKTDKYGADPLVLDCYCKAKTEKDAFEQFLNYCEKHGYYTCCDDDYAYMLSIGAVGEFNPNKGIVFELTEIDTNKYYLCSIVYKK